jgi:hypothetical protein
LSGELGVARLNLGIIQTEEVRDKDDVKELGEKASGEENRLWR